MILCLTRLDVQAQNDSPTLRWEGPMPKHYRIMVAMYDEDDQEIASSSHEETYDDNEDPRQKFQEKEKAARGAGKGRGQQR